MSLKFSQIASSPAKPVLGSDTFVGVNGGVTDYQYSWQQISLINRTTQTASYTLALTDYNAWVEMNVATANNLTIPLNATVPFPVNTLVTVVQIGLGTTTLVAAGGVTLVSAGSAVNLNGQYSSCTLLKRATDSWLAMGALV